MARKDQYWDKRGRGHEGPFDTIVIGSGMGGMTCAALLAKLGHKVLVLEQHYEPGGFTHTFKRKKWVWDVGVHAVGEVSERALPGRILKRLTDDRLKWASLGKVYDEFYFPDGFRIDFPDSKQGFRDNLVAAFPDEVEAIDEYIRLSKEVGRTMRGYYLARIAPRRLTRPADLLLARKAKPWFEKTTKEVVDGLTDNEQLRTIFTAQWGYYGSVPSRSAFAMQALVVRHFLHGGYYPVGGSGRIARELLRTVSEAGGWTRIYADVEQILVEGNTAVGVRLAGGEEIRADRVVSAAGVRATAGRLLPEHAKGAWVDEVQNLRPASAHVCLYLGFEGDITEAGAGPANKWFWKTWDSEDDNWNISDPDNLPDAMVLYCSFPSLKDPEHDPGERQTHTGEVVTFVPWELFEPFRGTKWKKRGEEYDALKKKLHDSLLEQFLTQMPGLRDKLKYSELSTPISTDHFVRPSRGSIYGLEPTPERFRCRWLRPKAPVDNLYFAGSEVSGVGVVGAMMGGVLAAAAVEPLKALRWLQHT